MKILHKLFDVERMYFVFLMFAMVVAASIVALSLDQLTELFRK